jgi:type III secretion system chaperone SycN
MKAMKRASVYKAPYKTPWMTPCAAKKKNWGSDMTHEHVIAEFGRRMGLPSLAVGREQPAQLRIDGMGTLFIEEAGEDILLYLARNFPAHDQDVPRRALALCRPALARPFPVYAGLYKNNTLVFLIRFTPKTFSLQGLEQAVPVLARLLDESLTM